MQHIQSVQNNRFQTQRLARKRQAGAVAVMDLMLWAGGMLIAMAFLFWLKATAWPMTQGWMESSTVSANIQKISSVYSGAANYSGLTTAGMATPSIFQAKYLPGGGTISNRFGGTVSLSVLTTNVNNDTISYTDTNIHSAACPTVANQAADDVDRITVAGTVVKQVGAVIDPNALKTQCDSAGNVSMIFDKVKVG
jgi:hypothetical protein